MRIDRYSIGDTFLNKPQIKILDRSYVVTKKTKTVRLCLRLTSEILEQDVGLRSSLKNVV